MYIYVFHYEALFVFYSKKGTVIINETEREQLTRGKCHLSCGVDWAGCVHSALQHGGMDGETAAERPAGGTGGTDCQESGGSSPGMKDERHTEERMSSRESNVAQMLVPHNNYPQFSQLFAQQLLKKYVA